jgi:hypothetical protein
VSAGYLYGRFFSSKKNVKFLLTTMQTSMLYKKQKKFIILGSVIMATKKTSVLESAENKTNVKKDSQKSQLKQLIEKSTKTGPRTRVVVRFDVGFNNFLTIRGKGAGLSWEKGTNLKNVKPDEWIWETDTPFNKCDFKILINDTKYEIGENHPISCGASIQFVPKF